MTRWASIFAFVCLGLVGRGQEPSLAFDADRFTQGVVAEHAVATALRQGYRRIQMSARSPNLPSVSRALADVPREQLSIAVVFEDADSASVRHHVDEVLAALRTDHIDLAYLRLPVDDLESPLRGLRGAKAAGQVREIGLSNFGAAHDGNLLGQVVSALRGTVSSQTPAQAFFGQDTIRDVAIVQIDSQLPRDPSPLAAELASMGIALECRYALDASYSGVPSPVDPNYRRDPYSSPLLADLASAHQLNARDMLVAWHLNQGVPVVIAVCDTRMLAPASISLVSLSAEEMATLSLLAPPTPSPILTLISRMMSGYPLYTR